MDFKTQVEKATHSNAIKDSKLNHEISLNKELENSLNAYKDNYAKLEEEFSKMRSKAQLEESDATKYKSALSALERK